MIITPQEIENTKAFKKLELFKKRMATKKNNRELIQSAIIHYKATKQIMTNIGATNVSILKELINDSSKA